ncbi:uncharacterized protein STEHIDRAFT_163121 [Stereum hirsutum FP-91666 SS1]|uniref:Uncharacterized protein n=1 Tax=Stereum hirsutum (strain FP-91666) TaxID=721885 RepID=R7RZJ1_STEHR|nr:uncharacterized protein STEHIDRAFT_163121 [Stereum hirsutum FP-91666 SS1]EIM80253.1 hypothetical protein STEHIDRAFT_163121 [Stereum hirsutum FP-91666 SS1]
MAARRTAADQQKALDEQLVDLLASQRELDDLKSELGRRRRVLLLLETLKKKEEIRITRMKEIDLLLQRLRGAQSTENAVYHPVDSLASSNPASSQGKSQPISLTRDTLTQLHIYHSTHSRIARSLVAYDARSVRDQQRRLQESIANALHVTVDDDRAVEWCAKLSAEAERRAYKKLVYRRPSPSIVMQHNPKQPESTHSIQSSVEDIIARLHQKEQNLQHLANGATALGQGCLSHIDMISKAIHHTAPELHSSLQTQARVSSNDGMIMPDPTNAASTSTQAYVNRLVEDILRSQGLLRSASSTKRESKGETVAKLETVLGVKGRQQIVSRVEEMLERDHRTRTFASRITLPLPSSTSVDPSDRHQLINATNDSVLTAQTTATDLLHAKLKQAEDVEGMVKEVRRLRRDVRAFVDSI